MFFAEKINVGYISFFTDLSKIKNIPHKITHSTRRESYAYIYRVCFKGRLESGMLELNQDTKNVEIVSSASRNTFFLIFGVNKNWRSCAWHNHTTISCIFLELLQKPRSVHTLCKPSTTSRLFGPMPSHRGPHASVAPHAEASAFVWAKNQDERVSGSGGKDFSVLHVLRATGGMALGSLAWCRPYEQKNRF